MVPNTPSAAAGTAEITGDIPRAAEAVTSISDEDDETARAVKRATSSSRACFIATAAYGDGNRYPEIFEANKPMLKDPDEIFPGQVLRIPQ